jgi:predicted AAA+ superfamily ATPase
MATSIGQRAQELASINPWWRGSLDWDKSDSDLMKVRQSDLGYRSDALDSLASGCLYILRGPRRVGKTVAVKQCIRRLQSEGVPPTCIVRAAVDGWSEKELRTLIQNTVLPPMPKGQTRYWFIDEITAIKGDWPQQIKWLRDNDAEFADSTVVLTGSNAASLTGAVGILAGRRGRELNLDRTLMPMGFKTFIKTASPNSLRDTLPDVNIKLLDLHSEQAAELYQGLLPWLDALVKLWETYLTFGGFPRMVASVKAGKPFDKPFVRDIFDVLFDDAFADGGLSTIVEMRLIERLWKTIGTPVNLTAIAQELDVDKKTVKRHIGYLQNAYLLWNLPQKSDERWLARKGAMEKVYAVDPVVARLAHLMNDARSDIDLTLLSEMQLGAAIRRRIMADDSNVGTDEFLFHYRSKTGKEIDFVSEYLGTCAIEGKYIEHSSWGQEAKTIAASQWNGILATRNELYLGAERNQVWAVPSGILAYLIDT